MIFKLLILLFVLIYYIVIANYFYKSPFKAMSFYLLSVLLFPNKIGFVYYIHFNLWQITALIFLVPALLYLFNMKKLNFNKIDLLVLCIVILSASSDLIIFGTKHFIAKIYKNILYIFLPYYSGRNLIRSKNDFYKILNIFIIGGIILTFIGIYEYIIGEGYLVRFSMIFTDIGQSTWGASKIYQRWGLKRVVTSFTHPVYLGVYFMWLFLIAFIIRFLKFNNSRILKIKNNKKNYLIILILSVVMIFLSGSRTGIVALLLTIFILLLKHIKEVKFSSIFKYLIIFILILIPFYKIYFQKYVDNFLYHNLQTSKSVRSISNRYISFNHGINYIKETVNLFGEDNRYYTNDWDLSFFELSNGFLNRLTTKGLFFILGYILLWILAFNSTSKLTNNRINYILFFSLVYFFFVENLTELNFQLEIIFYFLVGVCFNKKIYKKWNKI